MACVYLRRDRRVFRSGSAALCTGLTTSFKIAATVRWQSSEDNFFVMAVFSMVCRIRTTAVRDHARAIQLVGKSQSHAGYRYNGGTGFRWHEVNIAPVPAAVALNVAAV